MDRRNALLVLLLLLVLTVVAGGAWRLLALGKLTPPLGPQALARDGQGGFFLATDHEILRLDGFGAVRERRPARELGLDEINALAQGEGDTLYLYDSRQRRLHRCATTRWTCTPFASAALGLDDNVQIAWVYGEERRLLVADNTHHRLLSLGADGTLLESPLATWHFPNQILAQGEHVMLADSDTRRIVNLDRSANGTVGVALQTRLRPYRFVRRDAEWWVLEAGVRLERARLRHYLRGDAELIPLGLADPVALLDLGRVLVVAGKEDWRLVAIDPDTGLVTPFGSVGLRQEFQARREATLAARRERAQLPLVMTGLLLPLLGAGLLLQRRITRDARSAAPLPGTAPVTPPPSPAATRGGPARIDTDRDALAAARAWQGRQLKIASLLVLPLLAALGALLYLHLPGGPSGPARYLPALLLVPPLLVALALMAGRRQQDRLYDQHLLCGSDKLIHVVAGKPVRAVAYEAVWLGEESLVLGARRLPLYLGQGPRRCALWKREDLERELTGRIPAAQRLGETALGRALLARGQLVGLQVLAARFLVIIVILVIALLQLLPLALRGDAGLLLP